YRHLQPAAGTGARWRASALLSHRGGTGPAAEPAGAGNGLPAGLRHRWLADGLHAHQRYRAAARADLAKTLLTLVFRVLQECTGAKVSLTQHGVAACPWLKNQ